MEGAIRLSEFQKARYEEIISQVQGQLVINLGSTFGFQHEYLKERLTNAEIIGIDLEGNPDIKQNLNEPLLVDNQTADTVIAGEILEHLENPLGMIKEVNRVLCDGGIFIITIPNPMSVASLMCNHSEPYEHLYAFHPPYMVNLLQKAGFVPVYVKYIESFHVPKGRMLPGYIITRLFRRFSSNILIVSVKKRGLDGQKGDNGKIL